MCPHLMLLLFIYALPCDSEARYVTNIVNLEVQSKTDLRNQFALTKNLIIFQNRGPNTIHTYKYIVAEPDPHRIHFYNPEGTELEFEQTPTNESRFSSFVVDLNRNIHPNEKYTLLGKIAYVRKIQPAQKNRHENEDQVMKFENQARFFSSYYTKFSKVEYLLRNESLIETSLVPSFRTNTSLVYIFYNTVRFDSSLIEIVFVNNNAFLTITNLERTIDINHFGKIIIEDEVIVRNIGARLVGPYSPSALAPLSDQKGASNWLYTHLPASAENVQFYDVLGNSSATKIYHFLNYMTLKFRTRYPLFGGWKTSYVLRYEVPLYEYLFTLDSSFLLQIRAIDYVLDKMAIESVTIRIVLPEGALIKGIVKPEIIDFKNEEVSCLGGLCLFGRPVLVLNGSDLFDDYIVNVNVEYSLKWWYLLRAPLVLSIYLEFGFVLVICANKVKF
ncbi:hypothetical protein Zmor_025242 [Zophobas morio]|uniref:Dolichyl-diphosphooligosaccharide--protein glycosyltransferase subunit 1 n=1 Tax=Zophobas morio TaxID=2755281 RepID=A0AA38HRP2_9CUCU|nr:hypothetical protein Zmor_025242 [Zophobas morio]